MAVQAIARHIRGARSDHQLLRARAAGDLSADSRLVALIYDELHRLAERQMRGERGGHTLTPTALIHEAWLRLAAEDAQSVQDRGQFYALAARRMRQVLIDHARRRDADKRGGGVEAITLSRAGEEPAGSGDIDALALEQALVQLEQMDARKARVVELRYYAGLEMAEIAQLLDISRATAQRDWEVARAFLHLRLS
jgi:RNA polymerase sigma factor (TIGR02999 family)